MSVWWWALTASASVEEGYAAWSAQDVEGAIAAWRTESPSGVVAYDLGTALLAADRPVEAVAPLLAASRLRPRDVDVFHNLSLARTRLAEAEGEAPPPPASSTPAVGRVVTAGELAVGSLLTSVVAAVATLLRARLGGGAVAVALAVAGLALGVAGFTWWEQRAHPLAVVVATHAPLRDTPDPLATGTRDLPPGTEVRVVRPLGAFTLVEDGRGHRGWLPESALDRAW